MWRWLLLVVGIVAISAAIPLLLSFQPPELGGNGVAYPNGTVGPGGARGRVYLAEEPQFDFGRMSTFSKGDHSFLLKNVGEGPLTLYQGQKTCMCTVALFTNDSKTLALEPGETTTIKVTFETKDKNGKFDQSASVRTSDPEQPEVFFTIHGEVFPALVTNPDPPLMDYGSVPNDEPADGRFALTSLDKPDVKILEIVPSNPQQVSATAQPLTDEEKSHLNYQTGYRIDIKVLPSNELGSFVESLTVKTDHPKQSELVIPVRGKRTGAILVFPETVRAQTTSSKGAMLTVVLSVREQDETHFEIIEKPAGVDARIEKADDPRAGEKAKHYRLALTIAPGTPAGLIGGQIVLKADHPKVGVVRIPFNATIDADE
jgi:hypothetical protein